MLMTSWAAKAQGANTLSKEAIERQREGTKINSEDPEADPSKGSRIFTAKGPLVGDLATLIDKEIPGSVIYVEVEVFNGDAETHSAPVGGADILLVGDIVIEVKSGGGKGLRAQMDALRAQGLKPIAYAPDAKPSVIREVESNGYKLFRDPDALISHLRTLIRH